MSAPAPPRLRLKCRLHPCPAYRVLVLPDVDEQQLPTLTQVRDQAASAWQLSNADGLLLAILDADGDELALFEQDEWEGFLSSVVISTSAASANPLLRLCLTHDPRLSRNQAAHPTSASSSQPTPAPTPVKKSDIEIRNEALADSFTAMLHRARSTETPESRAREYASRFYAISKTEVVPAEVLAGRMGGDIAPGAGRGTGLSSSATASSSSKKDQVEKKREDWKARADQLYGSLVAVPPRNSAAPAPAPPISSEKAPAASPETITKQETTDPTSQSESSTARISSDHQEKPDTDGVKTPSPSVDQPEQNPPKTSSKRPKRPVEEVNSELNSAWETMLSRMRG
ncbi:hypothetical protein A4X09_0g171 [Tilletia walkeri]|uniref:PB1 domain-containing protein n=1 Tax=Tilletia walkeri TaxID=117179 RepID=A0A8X7NHW4_9BASI|nr:hypothetical protein A4X09_0g171 [Tilletia walkeri]